MRRALPILIPGFVLLLALFACSNDPSTPPSSTAGTLIEGEIGDADFEINVSAASRSGGSQEGPFVLRGRNLGFIDSLSALGVDLTVRNDGRVSQPEPVTLTFIDLIPSSVTVLNPDNGINGDGAAVNFSFANDDGRWTPREESLPRTVYFGVDSLMSIGFTGKLTVGEPVALGTIGGLVWNDADQDGEVDEGEEGIAGVSIRLSSFAASMTFADHGDDDDDDGDEDHHGNRDDDDDEDGGGNNGDSRTVRTGTDGRFLFENVPAGAYIVTKQPSSNSGMMPTTPTQVYVLLTERDGDVADFLSANFGCMVTP